MISDNFKKIEEFCKESEDFFNNSDFISCNNILKERQELLEITLKEVVKSDDEDIKNNFVTLLEHIKASDFKRLNHAKEVQQTKKEEFQERKYNAKAISKYKINS